LAGKTARKEMRRKRVGMAAITSTSRMMRLSTSTWMGLKGRVRTRKPASQRAARRARAWKKPNPVRRM